jgi:hypothetical protein
MVHLAAPLGLLALGALLVPLLLHLVRRPPHTVRVGDLRFLAKDRRPVRSLRWHRWLLLLLRCALLAALAFALAGVAWQPRTAAPARWLLLVPGTVLDPVARAAWDRLRAEGYAPRLLAAGFPLLEATPPTKATVDPWSLLLEADLAVPAGSRAHVFGPTSSTLFRGPRPALGQLAVTWHSTAAAPQSSPPPTPPPRVALVAAANRTDDARYLRALFTALGAAAVTDATADWVFQLGDVPLPPTLAAATSRGAVLVSDAPDAASPQTVVRTLSAGADGLRLHRRIDLSSGVALQRDSAGEPWLVETRTGTGRHWRFAFRFHPEWTDWPLRGAWATWWRAQLAPPPEAAPALAPEQAAPAFVPVSPSNPATTTSLGRIDLRPWAWWLAVLLFAVERTLSLRATRRKAVA